MSPPTSYKKRWGKWREQRLAIPIASLFARLFMLTLMYHLCPTSKHYLKGVKDIAVVEISMGEYTVESASN